MAFQKGQSGNPAGRQRGVKNKVTLEIAEASRKLVEDKAYVASLKERLVSGRAPHMETLLFHYAYGKPKEIHEFSGPDGEALPHTIVNNYVAAAPTADAPTR